MQKYHHSTNQHHLHYDFVRSNENPDSQLFLHIEFRWPFFVLFRVSYYTKTPPYNVFKSLCKLCCYPLQSGFYSQGVKSTFCCYQALLLPCSSFFVKHKKGHLYLNSTCIMPRECSHMSKRFQLLYLCVRDDCIVVEDFYFFFCYCCCC